MPARSETTMTSRGTAPGASDLAAVSSESSGSPRRYADSWLRCGRPSSSTLWSLPARNSQVLSEAVAVEEDAGNLVPDASLDHFIPTEDLPRLEQVVFDGYLRGLRSAGRNDDPRLDPAFKFTGRPNLRLLPDAPVPDGRTVLLGPPATTGSRSVGAGGIHRLSYQSLMAYQLPCGSRRVAPAGRASAASPACRPAPPRWPPACPA
jgi:hypothetical protein